MKVQFDNINQEELHIFVKNYEEFNKKALLCYAICEICEYMRHYFDTSHQWKPKSKPLTLSICLCFSLLLRGSIWIIKKTNKKTTTGKEQKCFNLHNANFS
ncbi:hypothetical protein RFI_30857 [Reticulomyxa filosa]|uniref:Uncharacterized protein n=1 Tax=Reticulomyxa filosa TaxID=46433 RepID=X6LX63_RETFI|nr:hypothetical protein RFI_30857 [Reticulomyxa filosa]|eukprot:ETO06533.1 hypothetical protein RFI_30857 [Reticulomyxa filosa]